MDSLTSQLLHTELSPNHPQSKASIFGVASTFNWPESAQNIHTSSRAGLAGPDNIYKTNHVSTHGSSYGFAGREPMEDIQMGSSYASYRQERLQSIKPGSETGLLGPRATPQPTNFWSEWKNRRRATPVNAVQECQKAVALAVVNEPYLPQQQDARGNKTIEGALPGQADSSYLSSANEVQPRPMKFRDYYANEREAETRQVAERRVDQKRPRTEYVDTFRGDDEFEKPDVIFKSPYGPSLRPGPRENPVLMYCPGPDQDYSGTYEPETEVETEDSVAEDLGPARKRRKIVTGPNESPRRYRRVLILDQSTTPVEAQPAPLNIAVHSGVATRGKVALQNDFMEIDSGKAINEDDRLQKEFQRIDEEVGRKHAQHEEIIEISSGSEESDSEDSDSESDSESDSDEGGSRKSGSEGAHTKSSVTEMCDSDKEEHADPEATGVAAAPELKEAVNHQLSEILVVPKYPQTGFGQFYEAAAKLASTPPDENRGSVTFDEPIPLPNSTNPSSKKGCRHCKSRNIHCPLVDDKSKFPCSNCVNDGCECERIFTPRVPGTVACTECRRRRVKCSHIHGSDKNLPCEACEKSRSDCIPMVISERKRRPKSSTLKEPLAPREPKLPKEQKPPKTPKIKAGPKAPKMKDELKAPEPVVIDFSGIEGLEGFNFEENSWFKPTSSNPISDKKPSKAIPSGKDDSSSRPYPKFAATEERPFLACTSCRIAKKYCSLTARNRPDPPCKSCKDAGCDCNFLRVRNGEVTEVSDDGAAAKNPGDETISPQDLAASQTIKTSYAHPITFNVIPPPAATAGLVQSDCLWCLTEAFGCYGHGAEMTVTVIDQGLDGYKELKGGYTAQDNEPNRMCIYCTTQRFNIASCATHEICVIEGLDPNTEFEEDVVDRELFQKRDMSDEQQGEIVAWCAICPKPATHRCCVKQDYDAFGGMLEGGEQAIGCGLVLCTGCAKTLVEVFKGDLQELLENSSSDGMRADAVFLSQEGELFRRSGAM